MFDSTTAWAVGDAGTVLKTTSGIVTSVGEEHTPTVPAGFVLSQNYPNPFNPSTMFSFTLQNTGPTTLKIFNIVGQEVATVLDEVLEAGVRHQVQFNARGLTSGMYFARLTSSGSASVRKIILLK